MENLCRYIMRGEQIPLDQRQNIAQLKDKNKRILAMYWVQFMKTTIPKYLIYKGFENHVDKNGYNLAIYWAIHCEGDIPAYLLTKTSYKQLDIYKQSVLVHWIVQRKQKVQKNLLQYCDKLKRIRDEKLFYPATIWIQVVKQDVPSYLLFSGYEKIKDIYGMVPAMYWIVSVSKKIPKYLLFKNIIKIKDKNGRDIINLWHYYMQNIPLQKELQ